MEVVRLDDPYVVHICSDMRRNVKCTYGIPATNSPEPTPGQMSERRRTRGYGVERQVQRFSAQRQRNPSPYECALLARRPLSPLRLKCGTSRMIITSLLDHSLPSVFVPSVPSSESSCSD